MCSANEDVIFQSEVEEDFSKSEAGGVTSWYKHFEFMAERLPQRGA
jgi:hypothetical protein